MVDIERARNLLRYMTASEWEDYRSILAVFADRHLVGLTPEEISSETGIDSATAQSRMQSLREWGNLTEVASTRNPRSLEDYYRQSKTYAITPSGQDAYAAVEDMVAKFDQVDDFQAGRLRTLRSHLEVLVGQVERGDDPSDTVQAAFDTHLRFAEQLRNFSAELNIWQRRYDLEAGQVSLLANVLISYFAQRLSEMHRETPRISRCIQVLQPLLPKLISQLERSGLAAQIEEAGLERELTVSLQRGTRPSDWEDMRSWFAPSRGSSEIDRITEQALAAVRTLTTNLTRLSRGGSASASRRSDFLRLAGFFQQSNTPEQTHDIASAAFGLGSCRRLGYPSLDMDDPHPITTSWRDAPKAEVPVSLRERGDTAQRGSTTPIRDRRQAQQYIKDLREKARAATREQASELIASVKNGRVDGCSLRAAPFRMLLRMISNATAGSYTANGIRCDIRREDNAHTTIETTEGRLVIRDRVVALTHEET